MENGHTGSEKVQNNFSFSVDNIPSIAITEDAEGDMGDLEADSANVPFSHYRGSLENIKETVDTEEDKVNTAETTVKSMCSGVLKPSSRFDTAGDTSQPGSRKVSFHSDVGSQPSSRKVSSQDGIRHDSAFMPPMQFLHPAYAGIPFAPNFRKVSSMYGGSSRKTSMDAFYCPQPMMPRYSQHGKVSVFSIGNASDTGYIEGDTEESIPQLGHYRISVFDNQRPTLFELRQEEQVGYHLHFIFSKILS